MKCRPNARLQDSKLAPCYHLQPSWVEGFLADNEVREGINQNTNTLDKNDASRQFCAQDH